MTLHQFLARSELVSIRERGVFPRHEKTVIGNLREVAERLAPGRACIPVVPDHGFAKTGGVLNLFPAFREAKLPGSGSARDSAGALFRWAKFFAREVVHKWVSNPFILFSVHDDRPCFPVFPMPAH